MQCKFFNTPRGCKFGKNCRYSHQGIRKGYDPVTGTKKKIVRTVCVCGGPISGELYYFPIFSCKRCYNKIDVTDESDIGQHPVASPPNKFKDYCLIVTYDSRACGGHDYHSFCVDNASHDKLEKQTNIYDVPLFYTQIEDEDDFLDPMDHPCWKYFMREHELYGEMNLFAFFYEKDNVHKIHVDDDSAQVLEKIRNNEVSYQTMKNMLVDILEADKDSSMTDIFWIIQGYCKD